MEKGNCHWGKYAAGADTSTLLKTETGGSLYGRENHEVML